MAWGRLVVAAVLVGCGAPASTETDDGSTGQGTSSSSSSTAVATETSSGSDGGTTGGSSDGSTSGAAESSTTGDASNLDTILGGLLGLQKVPVVPLEPPPPADADLVALGEALFFDPILSGNKDIACASCHHPDFGTSDGLALTLGTGAVGSGPERAEGPHPPFVPRHATSLFNIGHPSFRTMFWDGRVAQLGDDSFVTPAGDQLLPGLDSALAAQAMFPVLDRAEMRGHGGDMTVLGETNELAELADDDPQAIWAAIMLRLEQIPGYAPLFDAAFDGADFADLTFADATNAMAAYQATAFSFPYAPWDEYLAGDLSAIDDAAKRGAILFYGNALCSHCHEGALLTDHEFHNTGVPQLGPGQPDSAPFDYGRELVTGNPGHRYRFRTPALRNLDVSAPYMHDGAHVDFEALLTHYEDVRSGIADYDPSDLLEELQSTVQQDAAHIMEVNNMLDGRLNQVPNFADLSDIHDFLLTLTDPAVYDLPDLRPTSVPSGLDVP